jgi:5-formyltetrahydrofolate cyclo-ligase
MESREVLAAKERVRRLVWERLQEARASRFPFGTGRIPNFAGAEAAAAKLATLPEWRSAGVLKCNPDAAQMPVRRRALREGKLVYVAVPRLQGDKPFLELDPSRLDGAIAEAATIRGALRLGRPAAPEEMRPIDLVVCGAVAVRADGARLGKGGGYSDLEYAVVRNLGLVDASTPVVTTVHPLQVVEDDFPMLKHDIVLSHFATPEGVTACGSALPPPPGIHYDLISPEKRAEIAILRR